MSAHMFRRTALTLKMLILTAALGVAVWLVSDSHHTRSLKELFHERLAERFSLEAQEHRTRFDRHVRIHTQAAKMLAGSQMMLDYLHGEPWEGRDAQSVQYHVDPPGWMPAHSVLRPFVVPRYALLLDSEGRVRELYHWDQTVPSPDLLTPSALVLALSRGQSYLTRLEAGPYLLSSEPVMLGGELVAILMLAAPIDSGFLRESQALATTPHTVALLSEGADRILVSSDPNAVPDGIRLSELSDLYLTVGKGFFDYGSSDLVIRFASFIPLQEVSDLTQAALDRAREQRIMITAAFGVTFMLLIYLLTRRVRALTQRVVEFSSHMAVKQDRTDSRDELDILEDRFKTLTSAIMRETEALEYQASHDPLTDLPNRKLLNDRLQNELLRSGFTGAPLVLMVSDLDHFKEINDTLGHHVGDLVLQQAAERLYKTVRKADTVARLGGDEFSMLFPDTTLEQGLKIARQIGRVFESPFAVEGHNLNVGISIGIAEFPAHGDDVNILMQRADVAMYAAKQNGLTYAVYDPGKDTHHVSRLELLSDLRRAIETGSLECHYQCKLDIESGRVTGAEALLRWDHPDRGMIHPDELIPLAEKTGLIRPLTNLVLRKALQECARWRESGLDLSVAVNLSAQCLREDSLLDTLRRCLDEFRLPASACVLELTESDMMADPLRAKEILMELDVIGVRISVDDFGTGYSSLAYLKQLPISEIKVDRSFVREMLEDENDLVIVRAIVDLAHNLGIRVVAEGVHSREVLDMLARLKCNEAQGYFIRKPVPGDELLTWLQSEAR
ncbi:signal transduction protein containing a membrane domain an EAL and a GGDEF domain [Thioalkalivibrio sulfidiphilus HL-EbGr7]|uniref:cyclic-guanylate-specific phosphodiesterase n=2 Tax=Thioalkalivibrio TaxID=106633 RepID=B8GQI8_THISH|nr:signal transduction protein containing a membrane domain an EAL and a GGDEF domain [Thioalkalivibrio sulfidiphilus HL-EbGr7]